MSVKFSVCRVIGLSSDGEAVIQVSPKSRRLSVTPLFSDTPVNLFRSFGCTFVSCPYPNKTCKKCHLNFVHQVITKRR